MPNRTRKRKVDIYVWELVMKNVVGKIGSIVLLILFLIFIVESCKYNNSLNEIDNETQISETEKSEDDVLNDLYNFNQPRTSKGEGKLTLEDKVFYLKDYEYSPQLTSAYAYEYGIQSSDEFVVELYDDEGNYICRFIKK